MAAAAAGWEQAFDQTRQRPYYFNARTGERRWQPPSAQLPPGWDEAFDQTRQRRYFYNRGTGVRQWHPPAGRLSACCHCNHPPACGSIVGRLEAASGAVEAASGGSTAMEADSLPWRLLKPTRRGGCGSRRLWKPTRRSTAVEADSPPWRLVAGGCSAATPPICAAARRTP